MNTNSLASSSSSSSSSSSAALSEVEASKRGHAKGHFVEFCSIMNTNSSKLLVNPPVESGARARKARHGQGQSWDGLVMERASFSPARRAPAR
jgi:hypothetical protein